MDELETQFKEEITAVKAGNRMREWLALEATAVTQSAKTLDDDVVKEAVRLLQLARKVIVVGVGKSGIVAQKIAATFTSTGTMAVGLHPSEAMHGDLGLVTQGDVAIFISNSGATEELLALVPYIRSRDVPIIAIVGNLSSPLAYHSRVVIEVSVAKEACPLNLAPTASTTAAMAMGDALAMTVMEEKGVTSMDFARNHPSGKIGKRLTLRVQDLMANAEEMPLVKAQDDWMSILSKITQVGHGIAFVMNESHLIGVITDGDLRRYMHAHGVKAVINACASELMCGDPIVVHPGAFVVDALEMMESGSRQVSAAPVVDSNGKPVGLLRLHDIVACGLL